VRIKLQRLGLSFGANQWTFNKPDRGVASPRFGLAISVLVCVQDCICSGDSGFFSLVLFARYNDALGFVGHIGPSVAGNQMAFAHIAKRGIIGIALRLIGTFAVK
jgi:hypothetical protein